MLEHDWDNYPYFLQDWLDDNWKHLFVRQLVGIQGDFQPLTSNINEIVASSHRYRLEVVSPDHPIVVALGTDKDGFCISPPFDQVQLLIERNRFELIPFVEAEFVIVEV